jgi:undecaprenyl pyrophosphate synthase
MLASALTKEGGEVDLLIRTGGEKRLSDLFALGVRLCRATVYGSYVARLQCG